MKRLLNLIFAIFILISIGCSSEQATTRNNETAIEESSRKEKQKKNDFDVNTYKAEFEDIELQIPSSWVNENPYFYAEGAKDRTLISYLYIMQTTDSNYRDIDIKSAAEVLNQGFEARFENDDFKKEDIEFETINGISMARRRYENAVLSSKTFTIETAFFIIDDSLTGIIFGQADKSLYDHFDDFDKVIHSIKMIDKNAVAGKTAGAKDSIKKSTDFADSAKYTTINIDNFEIDFPEKWIRKDRFFYPTDDDNCAWIGYFVFDGGGFTEDWLDQAADIIFDEVGTGFKWSENEKVYVNGIRMQRIVADNGVDNEDGIKTTEYLFVNPVTTNAIGIVINEPADQVVDYMDDFESIVHSIRQVEPSESIATQESDKHEEIIEEEIPEEIPFTEITDLSYQGRTDYGHYSDTVAILGNNERLHLEIEASPAGLKEDDFSFKYDKKLLSYTVDSIRNDEKADKTTLKLTVEAKKPGYSTFEIDSSYYRMFLDDEEEYFISIPVQGLDSREGRIVYMTPSGEKYHFSKECAGENYIETTLHDVESMEFKPCGKCAR